MSEEFAIAYANQRAKEMGYSAYRIVYKDFTIPANQTLRIKAYNELWLLIEINWGMEVNSDLGRNYNFYTKQIIENIHEHTGEIEIINTRKYQRSIRFLQLILKTDTDGKQC